MSGLSQLQSESGRKRLILIAAIIFLVALAHAHRPTVTESPEARVTRRYQAQVGHDLAPALRMETAQGISKTLDAYKGQVVLLNFWASWCAPCMQEMPDLESLARSMRGRQFSMIALSADDSWQDIQKVLGSEKLAMEVYRDPSQSKKQHLLYGTEKFPETYVIDKQGKVRLRFINVQPWKDPAIRDYLEWLSDQ